MAKFKWFLDTLPSNPNGDIVVWDEDPAGFGIRVKPAGIKSFIIQYRTRKGRSIRMTLGSYGRLTPSEARNLARQLPASVSDG